VNLIVRVIGEQRFEVILRLIRFPYAVRPWIEWIQVDHVILQTDNQVGPGRRGRVLARDHERERRGNEHPDNQNRSQRDRKSTRLNSSHGSISYAVFCWNK